MNIVTGKLTASNVPCNRLELSWLTTGALQLVVWRCEEGNDRVPFKASTGTSVECHLSNTCSRNLQKYSTTNVVMMLISGKTQGKRLLANLKYSSDRLNVAGFYKIMKSISA